MSALTTPADFDVETVDSNQECDALLMDVLDDTPCGFVGDVPVWLDRRRLEAGWTCPGCGTDHVLSYEDFAEPDADYINDLIEGN